MSTISLTGTIWSTVTCPSGNYFHLSSSSNYLFGLTNYPGNNTLYKINLQNPASYSTLINNQVLYAAHQSNDSSYVYLPNYSVGGLTRYDFSGNKDNSWSCSTSSNPTTGVCIDGNYLYLGYQSLGYISQVNITNGSIISTTWASFPQRSEGLFVLNGYMYVNSDISNAIIKIQMNYANNPPTAGSINTNFIKYGFNSIAGYSNLIFGSGGNNIYVFDANTGTLLKILNITNAITGLSPSGLAVATISNVPYLFFGDVNIFQFSIDSIYSFININNSSSTLWSTNIPNTTNQSYMTFLNGYLFVSVCGTPGTSNGFVARVSMSNPSSYTTILSGLANPTGIDNDGTYFYLALYGSNAIYKYDISGTLQSWSSTVTSPEGVIVYGNYLYTSTVYFSLNYDSYLVLYYPFNSNVLNYATGVGVSDSTIQNGASISNTNYKVGTGSLSLSSASSQYLQINSNTLLNSASFPGTNGLTFSSWFQSNGNGTWARIFDFGNGSASNNIYLYINNNTIGAGVYVDGNGNTNGYWIQNINGTNYNTNVWYHVVWTMTYSSSNTSTWTVYINGTSAWSSSGYVYPKSIARTGNYIGRSNWADPYWNGNIDEFRCYTRVLNSTEITALYNYGVTSSTYNVQQVNLSTGAIANSNWAASPFSGYPYPGCVVNNSLYVCTTRDIYKIPIIAGSPPTAGTAVRMNTTFNNNITVIISYNNTVFVADGSNNIYQFDALDNLLQTFLASSPIYSGNGMSVVSNNLFSLQSGYIYDYPLTILGQPPCFLEGTQILTDKGYRPIQNLRKGDLVKTRLNGFLPIAMIGKKGIVHPASQERIKEQLYLCSTAHYPEITEGLIITGCHSILVDEFQDEIQRSKTHTLLGDIYITEDQYRLPACLDERAIVYQTPGTYMIYHLALMNNSWYTNYGIYANGLLVESCSKRYLEKYSGMELF
jgi:hypothetical protein